MRILSREELFDLAWSRPLTKVAKEFGVTSTALKKTCRRHHIPTPSRGYWTAVAAGGVFPRPKLGKAPRNHLETIRIVGAAPVSETVAEATSVACARVAELETRTASPDPTSPGDGPPPQLNAEHRRDLAPTTKAIAKIRTGSDQLAQISGRGVIPMTITPAVAERLMAWLELLLLQAEKHGATLEGGDDGAHLKIDGEVVSFRIEEKQDRTPHVPTAKELAEKAKRERWGYSSNHWPKYDYYPSGQLSLVIEPAGYSTLRRTYADGKTQTLKRMTAEILVAFAAHAASIRERRIAAEESRKLAAEAEARRQWIAAYDRREQRRRAFIDLISDKLQERDRLSQVLAHAESAGEAEMPAGMTAWLRRTIDEIDALVSPQSVEISARHVQIDFDEAAVASKPTEPSWCYPREVSLELWSIDESAGQATSRSSLEWAIDQGHLPASAFQPSDSETGA